MKRPEVIVKRYVKFRVSKTDCRTPLERMAAKGIVSWWVAFPFNPGVKGVLHRPLPGREDPEGT